MEIKAAVTRAPHAPQSLENIDLAEPRDNEILVRVVATGVCHTDVAMRDQTFRSRNQLSSGMRAQVLWNGWDRTSPRSKQVTTS